MSITARVEGDDRVVAQLQEIAAGVRPAVDATIGRLVLRLPRKVSEEKLSGQVLKVRSGTLRRSISGAVLKSPTATIGVVSTNIEYARIHEYGGTIKARIVEAKNKQALAFKVGGKSLVRKRVNIPAVRIPERSFLRSALREMAPEIQEQLMAAVSRVVRGGK